MIPGNYRPLLTSNHTGPPSKTVSHRVYEQYIGADYSFEYPAARSIGITPFLSTNIIIQSADAWLRLPVTLTGNSACILLQTAVRFFYSRGVITERDIWPRNMNGEVVCQDIINSILGNPDSCANSPEGSFIMAGFFLVPLNGIS